MQPVLAKWAAGPAVAERVLLFREGRVSSARRGKRHARRLRHAQRRALLRRLEHVTSQLERTPEYRHSLQSVLELGSQLQGVLDATQRERWLALEEALFDHTSRLHRAYFCAGVEYGQSKALAALVSSGGVSGRDILGGGSSGAGDTAAGPASVGELTRAAASSAATSPPAPIAGERLSGERLPGARRAAALELEILSALARWLGKLMRE